MRKILGLGLVLLISVGSLVFAGGGGEEAAEGEPEYRIGIVFDVGGRGDKSFNDSAYEGLVLLAQEFGGYIADGTGEVDFGRNVELRYLEPQQGGADRENLLRLLAEDGFDLVIGVGFLFDQPIATVSQEFPGVHFGIVDGFIPDLTAESNVTTMGFTEHEGSFLVGAFAGLMVQDFPGDGIGYMAGFDIPLLDRFEAGYMAGAMYANPDLRDPARRFSQFIANDASGFNDPQTAENIAVNMYNRGAAIVYHAAGGSGNGLFKAASDNDRLAIGVDSDQGLIFAESDSEAERAQADHIVTSMLKRVDQAVFLLGADFINNGGDTAGGYNVYGLPDGGVGYALNQYNEDILAPYVNFIDGIAEMIASGELVVPDNTAALDDWMAENL